MLFHKSYGVGAKFHQNSSDCHTQSVDLYISSSTWSNQMKHQQFYVLNAHSFLLFFYSSIVFLSISFFSDIFFRLSLFFSHFCVDLCWFLLLLAFVCMELECVCVCSWMKSLLICFNNWIWEKSEKNSARNLSQSSHPFSLIDYIFISSDGNRRD